MATVLDVVTRAHRLIGVVDREIPIEGYEAEIGRTALNDMLAGYEAQSVNLSHTDYASVSDTFETATLTAKYREHVTYLLAAALASEYKVPLDSVVADKATEGDKVLRANFLTGNDLVVDRALQTMPSDYWGPYRSRSG